MIKVVIFIVLTTSSYGTFETTIRQPFGPKMCRNFYDREHRSIDYSYDEVQLTCNLVFNTSNSDLPCNPSSEENMKLRDWNNKATSAYRDLETLCERKAANIETAAKNGTNKRMICPVADLHSGSNLLVVKRLVSQGMMDVNCRDKDGRTPVMHAAWDDDKKLFDFYVKQKCDLSIVDDQRDTVLHYACFVGSRYIVKKLLQYHKFDIDIIGSNGRTPLMSSMDDGISFFKFVCKRGANLTHIDDNNDTILHIACIYSIPEKMVKYVLSLNVIDIDTRGHGGRTPLMQATEVGRLRVVRLLMQNGANVNITDDKNNNILHLSCLSGDINTLRYILSLRIAEIDCRGYIGRTPLMMAVGKGKIKVVKFLKKRRVDMKAVDDENNNILHLACVGGLQMVRYVVSLHVHDIESRGKFGRTPLMFAAENGKKRVFRLLLQRCKADIKTTDDSGLTVLHIACQAGQLDMVKYLVTIEELRGLEKMKNKAGQTPISLAVQECHLDIVSLFESRGKI